MRLPLPLLLLAGCAVLPVSPRRMGTLEARMATLEKRMDTVEQASPAFSLGEEPHSAPVASVGMTVPYEAATKTLLATRNGSGTYSLPSGNPVVTGTSISSTWANNTLSDLATEMTDSLNRSGKGAMLAGLPGYVGTVSLPGYTFSGDLNTGLYWVSADDFGAAVGGTKVQEWAATTVTFTPGITVTQSQSNTTAGTFTGNGSGAGIAATGGATGNGGTFAAGATSGHGVSATGKGAGVGVLAVGGDSSGAGVSTTGGAPNGTGVSAQGTGTGSGGVFAGGATGAGLTATAGATSGVGLSVGRGNGVNATMRMATGAQPTGPNVVGDMYMSAGGILNICTVAGSPGTWTTAN